MKMNFVTLFNQNYLSRGLTLIRSLEKTEADFTLYVIAFDTFTYDYLRNLSIPRVVPVSLSEFEDEHLLSVKSSRSPAEYCWTCTPSTILYCIRTYSLDHCVYIDADMCFYTSPEVLFKEWAQNSILITKHRYTPKYDQSAWNGIYCVQFVGFKNDAEGIKALSWWRNACIDWCYDRLEDGKFGDQKYLDDWNSRFKNVTDLEYLGGGVAPWNVQQYRLEKKNKEWRLTDKASGKEYLLVFYHFHGFKFYENETVSFSGEYDLSGPGVSEIYKDYLRDLLFSAKKVNEQYPKVDPNGKRGMPPFDPISHKQTLKGLIKSMIGKKASYSDLHKNIHTIKEIND